MLRVEALEKRYGPVTALAGVTVEVAEGEVVALLGPNGAGKTTLVSTVAALISPDGGRVLVDGVDVAARPRQVRARLGLAPQELGLYPNASVRENLELFGRLYGVPSRALPGRVDELAAALLLEDLLDRPARHLSGGQQRRLHTGCAMVHRPRLLMLDEPTVGADVETRRALLEVVRRLAGEGTAVVYSTHYLGEVEELDARVLVLADGSVVADGSVRDLVATHASPALTLTFSGPVPDLGPGAVVEGSTARFAVADPAATAAEVLPTLGAQVSTLTDITMTRPDLEAAYLSVLASSRPAAEGGVRS